MRDNVARLAPLLFVVVVLSVSSASVLVLLSGASATACAFWRTLIAGAIIAVGTLRGFNNILSIKGRYLIYSVLAGVTLSAHFIMWMKSLFLIPVAVSTTVVITYPLFNALADALLMSEPPTKSQIIGLLTAFTGVVLFIHPISGFEYDVTGVLLALASALAVAGYFSLGRVVRKHLSLGQYASIAYLTSAAVTATYALVANENLINYSIKTYVYFILLATIPMLGGHTLMNFLLRYFKTYVVSSLGFMEPVGASILAYVLLKQYLNIYTVASMALVLAGVFLVVAEESRSVRGRST